MTMVIGFLRENGGLEASVLIKHELCDDITKLRVIAEKAWNEKGDNPSTKNKGRWKNCNRKNIFVISRKNIYI